MKFAERGRNGLGVGVLLLALCSLGCASNLLVAAPAGLTRLDPARLGAVPPVSVTLGAVADAPSLETAVGRRGAAPLQPGGPIHLTEDVGTILRRSLGETLTRAGHRVVAESAAAHIAVRLIEFQLDAPRAGAGWDVKARVRILLRVSARPGDADWDEVSALAERTLFSPVRPGISTVESVLRGCLDELAGLLASRPELAAALNKHARRTGAG